MQNAKRGFLVCLGAAALVVAAVTGSAQQLTKGKSESLRAQGELLRVDTTNKTFAVRVSQDKEMQFRYTDATKITGAEQGIAGLATMAGSQLTVEYAQKDKDNVATRIDIQRRRQG